MEDFNAPRGILSGHKRKPKAVCRVCLKKSKGLVNIFDIKKLGISIADMISKCTGFHIFKGDSFPDTICPPCLKDAKNAFEIKQTYEGSHQFFLQLKQASEERKDLLEDENCIQGTQPIDFPVKKECNEDFLEESAPQMEYFQIDEYFPEEVKKETIQGYLPGEVMNEPIEDDPLEEDAGGSIDYEIDPSYLQAESHGTDDHEQCPNLCTPNGDSITNAKEIPFQCSLCPSKFATHFQLKLHGTAHTKPTFKCDFCEMAFVHQSTLTQHERRHTGERPFKCAVCQQTFTNQTQFSVHFKSHPLNRLFKCSHCELAFTSQEELDQHIKTHTKKQMYNCSHCQKVFRSQQDLKKHFKTTHREKRSHIITEATFKCSYCDKCFTRNQALVLHMKFIHHVQPVKCKINLTPIPRPRYTP